MQNDHNPKDGPEESPASRKVYIEVKAVPLGVCCRITLVDSGLTIWQEVAPIPVHGKCIARLDLGPAAALRARAYQFIKRKGLEVV